jgi:hypothetical protein
VNSDIEVEVGAGGRPGEYVVRVVHAVAGGEPTGTLKLDVEDLRGRREQLEQAILSSSVRARRLVPAIEQPVRQLGLGLFEALFAGPVRGTYRACLGVAGGRDQELRLVLRLTAPELAVLPWEAMFDPETGTYLCRREPLVRHVPAPYTSGPLEVSLPLRILGLVASPRGLPLLDVEAEQEHLTEALAQPLANRRVELRWVRQASWDGVHERLLAEPWHVVHFVGHGDFDPGVDEGVIALAGEDGRADLVGASRLADLLSEARPTPRLVVLNSCASGRSGLDLFSGTAAALVRSGIHAVAAMQFTISDRAAIRFARGFYTALAEGRDIDEAARSGRIAILGLSPDTLEWITPVLYLRGSATRLFTFTNAASAPQVTGVEPAAGKAGAAPALQRAPGAGPGPQAGSSPGATADPAYIDGLSALFTGRLDDAVGHFTALTERYPDDPLAREYLQEARWRKDCAGWYAEGVWAAERGAWDQAVAALERIPPDHSPYPDTADRLKRARWEERRKRLIEDVRRLHAARQWDAVLAAGQELADVDPATPDPDGLIAQAREALADDALASRYATGLRQLDRQDWLAALSTFAGIEQDRPGYRDTPTLLKQLQQRQRPGTLPGQIHATMYGQAISRKNPGCIVILLDRSDSMKQTWENTAETMAERAARALDETLLELISTSQREPGEARHYFDVGIFGYGKRPVAGGEGVESAFGGELAGRALVPLPDIQNNPIAVREIPSADAGAPRIRMPVWVEPAHGHRRPLCQAIAVAGKHVFEWAQAHPASFPPIVINITSGFVTDNPYDGISLDDWTNRLSSIQTDNGLTLLFNIFLSPSASANGVMFPVTDFGLPAPGPELFRISSVLPPPMIANAKAADIPAVPGARGFGFNINLTMLVKLFSIGTKIASGL